MSDKEEIKINHPEHGHVLFSQMSSRQMDMLEILIKIQHLITSNPNDRDLGKKVRKLLNK